MDFSSQIQRFQFQSTLRDLFEVVAGQGWKVKLTFWDPKNGEEWEVTPIGSKQTKRPQGQRIKVSVVELKVPVPVEDGEVVGEGGL